MHAGEKMHCKPCYKRRVKPQKTVPVVTRREGLVRQGRGVSLIAQSNAFISYAYDL